MSRFYVGGQHDDNDELRAMTPESSSRAQHYMHL